MIKRIAFLMTLVLTAVLVNAIPVRLGNWKKIPLVDGTFVQAQLKGDESLHYWESADGVRYVKSENAETYERIDASELQSKVRMRRSHQRAKAPHLAQAKQRKSIYQGKKKALMILMEFSDRSFVAGHNVSTFSRVANEIGYSEYPFEGSVKDYFLAQSNGQFELDFDVVGPVKVSQKSSYYAGRDGLERVTDMIREATLLAEDLVNFADYDWDGDGEVEQIYVLYAGKGQHDGGGSSSVWPHEWSMTEDGESKIQVDGVWVDTYSCGCELDGENKLAGIGLLCHEYSHCMGIMDMYDTNDDGYFGMDCWDIMDYGCYNGDGYRPCGYTSYEKWVCGWLDPIELKSDTMITEMKALSDHGDAYIIYNDNCKDEYYLLENRQPIGWDDSLDGAGLLVLHVDYDETIWINNVINTIGSFRMVDGYTDNFSNDHQRLTIFHADNRMGSSVFDLAGDTYPYGTRDSLTTHSVPAAKVYNVNTDGLYNLNKGLRNITQNDDGTISFNFVLLPSETEQDTIPVGGNIFAETFDLCKGTGGNDGQFSGQVASSTFLPDNEGWDSSKCYGGDQCAKFGNSSVVGVVYSPPFYLNGNAILTFKAAAFGKDGNGLDIYIDDSFVDVVSMSNTEWTTYQYEISGNGITKIGFIPDKRFFLDEVYVIKSTDTGIHDVEMNQGNHDRRVYSLDGQCLGTSFNSLPHGIYIYQGKKFVK